MEVIFMPQALEDIKYWKMIGAVSTVKKIQKLLKNIIETPYAGIGKPEPLKHDLSGRWSRRITEEHRLVYGIKENKLIVYQLRFHY